MRLDKLLGNMGYGTRKDIKKFAKDGLISVDGKCIKDSSVHVDTDLNEVFFDGEQIQYREFVYIMLNKPKGYLSATEDSFDKTVVDLLDEEYHHFQVFPVGRLDKDTEGLLILTNEGRWLMNCYRPKNMSLKNILLTLRVRLQKRTFKHLIMVLYSKMDTKHCSYA